MLRKNTTTGKHKHKSLVFGGVNHSAHEHQAVGGLVVDEEEEGSVDVEGWG